MGEKTKVLKEEFPPVEKFLKLNTNIRKERNLKIEQKRGAEDVKRHSKDNA